MRVLFFGWIFILYLCSSCYKKNKQIAWSLKELSLVNPENTTKNAVFSYSKINSTANFEQRIRWNGSISTDLQTDSLDYTMLKMPRAIIAEDSKKEAYIVHFLEAALIRKYDNYSIGIRSQTMNYLLTLGKKSTTPFPLCSLQIQGKPIVAHLSGSKNFEITVTSAIQNVLTDTNTKKNINYLFGLNDIYNEAKLQTTTISFDEYQQQSKWDNYLYVSTHNLGQQEKEIIREMREMLKNYFD